MKDLNIVFMGTPEFAVTILAGILNTNYSVVGVITAPDKPAGRGQKITESAVKRFAVEKQLPILQPPNLKDLDFQEALRSLKADLFVVVAFRMLPESVWSMPSKGTINLHASLLPQYRGAAPINWAIINGETETGVTTFFIEKEIDTGKIIHQSKALITSEMTAGDLHDQLAQLGSVAVLETLEMIVNNTLTPIDQKDILPQNLKQAPKIQKVDTLINWTKNAKQVHDFIRGMSPYPGAWCKLKKGDKIYTCKVYTTTISSLSATGKKTIDQHEDGFLFPCADKMLLISELQIEGKRRMNYLEFSAGNAISDYEIVLD